MKVNHDTRKYTVLAMVNGQLFTVPGETDCVFCLVHTVLSKLTKEYLTAQMLGAVEGKKECVANLENINVEIVSIFEGCPKDVAADVLGNLEQFAAMKPENVPHGHLDTFHKRLVHN